MKQRGSMRNDPWLLGQFGDEAGWETFLLVELLWFPLTSHQTSWFEDMDWGPPRKGGQGKGGKGRQITVKGAGRGKGGFGPSAGWEKRAVQLTVLRFQEQ